MERPRAPIAIVLLVVTALASALACSKPPAGKGPPPHLSCGPRAFALRALLEALGYSSRIVSVIGRAPKGGYRAHTFLEVYDPQRGEWQIQDPDEDLVYVRGEARLGVLQLVLGSLEEVEPRRGDGARGWEASGAARFRDEGYFGAVLFDGRPDYQRSLVVQNVSRLWQEDFPAHVAATYAGPRLLQLSGVL